MLRKAASDLKLFGTSSFRNGLGQLCHGKDSAFPQGRDTAPLGAKLAAQQRQEQGTTQSRRVLSLGLPGLCLCETGTKTKD